MTSHSMNKSKTKTLKLNTDLRGFKAGEYIEIELDDAGVVKDKFWRNRVADSAIDGCVEFASKPKTDKKGDTK